MGETFITGELFDLIDTDSLSSEKSWDLSTYILSESFSSALLSFDFESPMLLTFLGIVKFKLNV